MQELGFVVLAILGYPFLVAWLVGLSKGSRIAELEQKVEALNERVHRFTTPPSPIVPAWRPADAATVSAPRADLTETRPSSPAADGTIAPRSRSRSHSSNRNPKPPCRGRSR